MDSLEGAFPALDREPNGSDLYVSDGQIEQDQSNAEPPLSGPSEAEACRSAFTVQEKQNDTPYHPRIGPVDALVPLPLHSTPKRLTILASVLEALRDEPGPVEAGRRDQGPA